MTITPHDNEALGRSEVGKGRVGDLQSTRDLRLAENGFESRYRRLWMFAVRHFPELTDATPRKDVGGWKPQMQAVASAWWQYSAKDALALGFTPSGITTFAATDSQVANIRSFIERPSPDTEDDSC